MSGTFRSSLRRYAGTLLAVAATSALLYPFRAELNTLNVALIYLIVVTALSLYGSTWSGILASVTAFFCFDLFFIPPYYLLSVAHFDDVLVLLVFLGIAVLTSQLVVRVHQKTEEALQRGQQAAILYELSTTLIGEASLEDMLAAIAQRVERSFALDRCTVLLHESVPLERLDSRRSGRGHVGRLHGDVLQRTAPRAGAAEPEGEVETLTIPIATARRSLGALVVARRRPHPGFDPSERQLLQTFANQAAIAIERIVLTQEKTRSEILAESDALKSALLSAVSHDLRTPLASIKASATSLLQPGLDWLEEDRHELLEAIDHEADRLNRLVANLLDLSRIEAGALRPALDWCELGEIVYEAINRCETPLADHRLRVRIPEDLPPLRLDFIQIEQVLINLLENAAKFSPPGSAVEVTVERRDGDVLVSVRDEGIGVPPGEEERIFNKFYRVASARRPSGSGLGLSICRGLLAVHGGRIWVEPSDGPGTTVRFTLPLPLSPVDAAEESRTADVSARSV